MACVPISAEAKDHEQGAEIGSKREEGHHVGSISVSFLWLLALDKQKK
jgi:hypothetical protein